MEFKGIGTRFPQNHLSTEGASVEDCGWLQEDPWIDGSTVIIPKDGNSAEERPITCLNTMYKLLTGVLTIILYEHVMTQGFVAR
jgi:hypothetical protein